MKNFIVNLLLKFVFFINKENKPPQAMSRQVRFNPALTKALFERNTFAYFTMSPVQIVAINKVEIVPQTYSSSQVQITAQEMDGTIFTADSTWFTLFEECHVKPKQSKKFTESLHKLFNKEKHG